MNRNCPFNKWFKDKGTVVIRISFGLSIAIQQNISLRYYNFRSNLEIKVFVSIVF